MSHAASSEAVTVRQATENDSTGILACLSSAFEPYRHSYAPSAFEDTVLTPGALDERLRRMSVFVAVAQSGEIVGTIACAVVDRVEGHLRGMAVLPEWQGKRVAGRLLAQAEAELSQRGCKRITLGTTEPLISAMRFYERNGFRHTCKVTDFFGMPLIEYAKPLSDSPRNRSDPT
jgi:GNAT superfamily N-acetyltransferase